MLDIINNIDKIHTTPLGKERIIKNLNLNKNEMSIKIKYILKSNYKWYNVYRGIIWVVKNTIQI